MFDYIYVQKHNLLLLIAQFSLPGWFTFCREIEYFHLTQSSSLIRLQPQQPSTTSTLDFFYAVGDCNIHERKQPGRPGVLNGFVRHEAESFHKGNESPTACKLSDTVF